LTFAAPKARSRIEPLLLEPVLLVLAAGEAGRCDGGEDTSVHVDSCACEEKNCCCGCAWRCSEVGDSSGSEGVRGGFTSCAELNELPLTLLLLLLEPVLLPAEVVPEEVVIVRVPEEGVPQEPAVDLPEDGDMSEPRPTARGDIA
jgi:hypothetical protein